jgi:hypothetical protein
MRGAATLRESISHLSGFASRQVPFAQKTAGTRVSHSVGSFKAWSVRFRASVAHVLAVDRAVNTMNAAPCCERRRSAIIAQETHRLVDGVVVVVPPRVAPV